MERGREGEGFGEGRVVTGRDQDEGRTGGEERRSATGVLGRRLQLEVESLSEDPSGRTL